MAEMLKSCTQHESSSLQMVGFLSVLAISGSLALISFMGSKSKLLRQGAGARGSWTTLSQEDFEEEEEVHTHSHGDFHSQEDLEEGEEEEEEEQVVVHTYSHTHSLLDSSFEENKHSPTHLKSLHEPTRATLKRKKKVRFASDVVEPPSNGQQYRSKWKVSHLCHKPAHLAVDEPPCNDQVLAIDEPPLSHHQHYKSKRRVSYGLEMRAHFGVDDPPCNDCMYVDASAHNDQQYKSTCKVSQRDATHARLSYRQMPSKLQKDSQGCEMHGRLSHPPMPSKSPSSIPPNRLALYKGLRHSRLQYSLHRL